MINIRTLRKLKDEEGLTLKGGKIIRYKSGYQVATVGIVTADITAAMKQIRAWGGNCGVWFSAGLWYIDVSHRESTLANALVIGRAYKQQSIYCWRNGKLVYC